MSATREELRCYYSAFRADDVLVDVIPTFDHSTPIPLLSSLPVGPLKAGMAAKVPLWLALNLFQRSLCTIVTPTWLNAESLADIIAFEKKEGALWTDSDRLPVDYYEIAKRLSTSIEDPAVLLLIQDLFEVRLDKLRQQFQQLFSETADADLLVAVNGIGTQELAVLESFVVTALNDQNALGKSYSESSNDNKGESSTTAGDVAATDAEAVKPAREAAQTSRTRVPIRRFRS